MPFNPKKKLEDMVKINPLTNAEKASLWSRIEKAIGQKSFALLGLSPRFAFASLMSIIMIAGSAFTVSASNDAGPGDILYPIDLAIERVQLALASNEEKDNLRLRFAEERLSEARHALALNGSSTDAAASSTSDQFSFKDLKKQNLSLDKAIDNLEKTKKVLEKNGNESAAEKIDAMIEELGEMAEEHMTDLDDVKIKVKDDDDKKKDEINALREKIKVKFKNVKVEVCHASENGSSHTIKIAQSALQAHLDHGDTAGECGESHHDSDDDHDEDDENGHDHDEDDEDDEDDDDEDEHEHEHDNNNDNSTSTADVLAPVISNIASSVSTNTASITWTTDELSDSKVWYATTTPIDYSATPQMSSSSLVLDHSISLTGLNSTTTYYYIVGSADASGNEATSTAHAFQTP